MKERTARDELKKREKQERNRERDENSERLWPLVLQKSLSDRQGQKKIAFRVFIFFLKASLLNSFF